jgi:hypothetical protein
LSLSNPGGLTQSAAATAVAAMRATRAACQTSKQILETYYSYALSASTRLSVDYRRQPGYNTDRGRVNFIAGRFHWQF